MTTSHLIDRIRSSGYFDEAWYLYQYPDVADSGISALEHYVRVGHRLMRDPGPLFSTRAYLLQNPDVAKAGLVPLWHYLAHGRREGRAIRPSTRRAITPPRTKAVTLLDAPPPREVPARVLCFYLPQFHPIAENDEWWGEGFTEWTNVKPARAQYVFHYQPHVPGELGHYDLRKPAVQRRQVELAKLYGVGGFVFYAYWFGGKRLLETPLQQYLDDPDLDLPFCLCWANENWSRRWDGLENEILIGQKHSAKDDIDFIRHYSRYLRDPRYIRVEGKPLLLVYRPNLLPSAAATGQRWREWCRDNGIGEIYLAYTQSFDSMDPAQIGFDAAIEFPPNNSRLETVTSDYVVAKDFEGRIYDWSGLVARSENYAPAEYPLFRGVCPSWDNTARRRTKATVLANSNPEDFTRWTSNAIADTRRRFGSRDERLVFVNAWNEWAEGAHLEPDRRYGYAWLESIRVAQARNGSHPRLDKRSARIAIAITAEQLVEHAEAFRVLHESLAGKHLFVVTTPIRSSAKTSEVPLVEWPSDVPFAPSRFVPMLRDDGFSVLLDLASRGAAIDVARIEDGTLVNQAIDLLCRDNRAGLVRIEKVAESSHPPLAVRALGTRCGLTTDDIAQAVDSRAAGCGVVRLDAMEVVASLAFTAEQLEADGELRIAAPYLASLSVLSCGLDIVDDAAVRLVLAGANQRAIVVSHDAYPHGAQLLALGMARTLSQFGIGVDLIVLGDGPLLEKYEEVAQVHRVDLSASPESPVLALLESLLENGAEYAIVNTTVSGLLVPLLKRAGIRTVSLIHELPVLLASRGLQKNAQAIAKHSDTIVFPSVVVRNGFEEFVGSRLPQSTIRPQGLYQRNPHAPSRARARARSEVRSELGLPADSKIVLCAGYADRRKGTDLFIEVCTEMMRGDHSVYALWVGHRDEKLFAEELTAALDASGFKDRFRFTGFVHEPQRYFSASDIYALTSREDPFPSVVMEAMDTGVPVLGFRGSGGATALIERSGGITIDAFDTGAMASAALGLLNDADKARRVAEEGKTIIATEYSFNTYMQDLLHLAGSRRPRVSVVVPNFNYERYISERLRSIVEQTLPVYELIILDDASTDGSVDRIREFLDEESINARLVVNETNSGSVFKQWLKGVELARGDLVWIAEADDLADPDFLKHVVPAFEDENVVMSYSQSRQMDSDGEILCEHYLDYVSDLGRERWQRGYTNDGISEIREALFVKNTIPNVSAVVFRREALLRTLETHGEEIMGYRNAGDWVAYIRLLERGSIAFHADSLNSHRRHQGSVTIGSFNTSQLLEIRRVQQTVASDFNLGAAAKERSDAYLQNLYEHFGLASETYPRFDTHPELTQLATST